MWNARRLLLALRLVGTGTLVGSGVRSVLADGAPSTTPLFYSGTLTEGGQLVNGQRDLVVNVWASAAGTGSPACSTPAPGTQVVGGRFRVALAAPCKAAL